MLHGSDFRKPPPKTGRHREKSTKEKTLESGSGFLPNVGRKQLLRSIREEKDPVARDRLVACLHGKDGCSIRDICKIMVRPYSTMRDWLWRMHEGGFRRRHDRRRGRPKRKIPKDVFRAVRRCATSATPRKGTGTTRTFCCGARGSNSGSSGVSCAPTGRTSLGTTWRTAFWREPAIHLWWSHEGTHYRSWI